MRISDWSSDVCSSDLRTFSYDALGNFTLTPQSSDYTPDFLLVHPLRRINASAFLKYDVFDNVELYGRLMYSDLRTRGGSRSGQNPPTTGANGINVQIAENNTFLDPQARPRLTFVHGLDRKSTRLTSSH